MKSAHEHLVRHLLRSLPRYWRYWIDGDRVYIAVPKYANLTCPCQEPTPTPGPHGEMPPCRHCGDNLDPTIIDVEYDGPELTSLSYGLGYGVALAERVATTQVDQAYAQAKVEAVERYVLAATATEADDIREMVESGEIAFKEELGVITVMGTFPSPLDPEKVVSYSHIASDDLESMARTQGWI